MVFCFKFKMDAVDRVDLFTDSSTSSLSSSEEEDQRRERVVKPRNDLFTELDEIEFKKRFRVSKMGFQRLVNMLEDLSEPLDNRNQPVSKQNQVLIALRFYATGSFQINLGDHFNVSQSTISRIVCNVTRHIAAFSPQYIRMPQTEEEQRQVVLKYFDIAGLPGVIGALDCTHIKIQSPGGENGEVFRNRKNWFSINTQVVVDADLKLRDIVARWPGSVHDSTIFNDSNIRARFEDQQFSPYCLVGDAGYACRAYLLTPLTNPQTPAQLRYNKAQISTRNPVERYFGVWKRRFPCLSLGMRIKTETVCEVVVACGVLHNMCIEANDLLNGNIEDIPELDEAIGVVNYNHQVENTATRDSLIATVFS